MGVRFFILIGFFILLYTGVGARLYRIQVERSDYYVERAEARNELAEALALRRGRIVVADRNGTTIPVAINRDATIIYAVPREIKNEHETAAALAPLIGWESDVLLRVLEKPKSLFRLLVDKAPADMVEAVREQALTGIYIGKKQYRLYPFGELAAPLMGFVGLNEINDTPIGLYGIEKRYQSTLAKGEQVSLTIDRAIQVEAERMLIKLMQDFSATGGTVIVEEPATGRILGLANAPSFDPNAYGASPVQNFINPAVQHVYEPGSVFKPLTMAAGIDAGLLTPETVFVDTGSVTMNGKTITNWDGKAYGKITMTNVIERSVNTGAVFAMGKIGHDRFLSYLKWFGFGETTGIDLPDEMRGSLVNLERRDARPIDFATASFGQGTAVTPIQLVNAFSGLANGGVLMRPFVNSELGPEVVRRMVSKSAAAQALSMMESAVEKAGVARIPGYRIAGKTGTAQVPNFEQGGYSDAFIHTFVGIAPFSSPRVVILIKLDKPNVTLAGFTVVPAFKTFAQFVLNYYNIPPDKLASGETATGTVREQ